MPKLTKQEKHKKREANRAKLHAKQKQPQVIKGVFKPGSCHIVGGVCHQPGMAFRHSFVHDEHLHIVHCPIINTRSIF